MSYSSDPVADARAYYDPIHAREDERITAEIGLSKELHKAIGKGDANALCPFAFTPDTEGAERPIDWSRLPKRMQTLAEVLNEALDFTDGPSITELMQLLLNAKSCRDVDLALQAGELLDRMAAKYVEHNVGV